MKNHHIHRSRGDTGFAVLARSFALAASFAAPDALPLHILTRCWRLRHTSWEKDDAVVWQGGKNLWCLALRFRGSTPPWNEYCAIAEDLFGEIPQFVSVRPMSLRLPVVAPMGWCARRGVSCARVVPPDGASAWTADVCGAPAEIGITVTNRVDSREPRFNADVHLGGALYLDAVNARKYIYVTDHRRIFSEPNDILVTATALNLLWQQTTYLKPWGVTPARLKENKRTTFKQLARVVEIEGYSAFYAELPFAGGPVPFVCTMDQPIVALQCDPSAVPMAILRLEAHARQLQAN